MKKSISIVVSFNGIEFYAINYFLQVHKYFSETYSKMLYIQYNIDIVLYFI